MARWQIALTKPKFLRIRIFALDICDIHGEKITGFSTRIPVDIYINTGNKSVEVKLSSDEGIGLPHMLPGALALWNERRFGMPKEPGRQLTLDPSGREAWLEVAVSDFRKYSNLPSLSEVVLDGTIITDKISFCCVFGEAYGGPGSYGGRGLDAFEDCLNSMGFPAAQKK